MFYCFYLKIELIILFFCGVVGDFIGGLWKVLGIGFGLVGFREGEFVWL